MQDTETLSIRHSTENSVIRNACQYLINDCQTLIELGVTVDAVAGLHTRYQNGPDCFYIRLHDGRVFDESGKQCESDLALYDAEPEE